MRCVRFLKLDTVILLIDGCYGSVVLYSNDWSQVMSFKLDTNLIEKNKRLDEKKFRESYCSKWRGLIELTVFIQNKLKSQLVRNLFEKKMDFLLACVAINAEEVQSHLALKLPYVLDTISGDKDDVFTTHVEAEVKHAFEVLCSTLKDSIVSIQAKQQQVVGLRKQVAQLQQQAKKAKAARANLAGPQQALEEHDDSYQRTLEEITSLSQRADEIEQVGFKEEAGLYGFQSEMIGQQLNRFPAHRPDVVEAHEHNARFKSKLIQVIAESLILHEHMCELRVLSARSMHAFSGLLGYCAGATAFFDQFTQVAAQASSLNSDMPSFR